MYTHLILLEIRLVSDAKLKSASPIFFAIVLYFLAHRDTPLFSFRHALTYELRLRSEQLVEGDITVSE